MTREEATIFLDKIIDYRADIKKSTPEELRLITGPTGIHFWDVRPLIDALEVEYKYERIVLDDNEYPHKLTFMYSGVPVFAIYDDEQYKGVSEWMRKDS